MVNERLVNADQYYKNISSVLKTNGISVHFFSTLYSFPFVVNKMVPEYLSDLLLNYFAPRDRNQHGKFKAHCDWSRGPTCKMIDQFTKLGFEAIQNTGYSGHKYYEKRFPVLHNI